MRRLEHPALAGAKRCDCGRVILRERPRGPLPARCTECRAELQRKRWRETKRRRAKKYAVAGLTGGGGVPWGGTSLPRHPLARRRASRWRWLAAQEAA